MVVRLARHPRRHVPPPAISKPAATHQHPSPPDTPAAGLANAGGGAVTGGPLPCTPPPPTRRAAAGRTDPGGDTPAPLPAQHARRRACKPRRRSSNRCAPPLPAPPPTRRAAAGNTDASGNQPRPMVALNTRRQSCQHRWRSRHRCTPPFHAAPPPTHRAAAGNTDAGGNPPLPMPAAHVRRRSGQRRRRGSHMKTSTSSAAPPKDPLRTTLSKKKIKPCAAGKKNNLLYSHLGRNKRPSLRPHAFRKVMPQALVLLLVPCLRPSVQRVAKTSGRKRAGRRDRRQPCPPASGCHLLHRTASRALYMTSGRLSTCSKKYFFASCRHFLVRICHFSAAMSSAATGRF